jgi:pyruvate formate lyase activating enzyme
LNYSKTPIELFQHLQPQLELLKSIGGLTISGGEPLLQPVGVRQLLELCRADGIHTAVETSASLPLAAVKSLTDVVDCWLIGLRPTRADVCPPEQVADLEKVKENLHYLAQECGNEVIIRFPIIPGYTDHPQAIAAISAIMHRNQLSRIELLPFNPMSSFYYQAMGMDYPLAGVTPPPESQIRAIQEQFLRQGFAARIVV